MRARQPLSDSWMPVFASLGVDRPSNWTNADSEDQEVGSASANRSRLSFLEGDGGFWRTRVVACRTVSPSLDVDEGAKRLERPTQVKEAGLLVGARRFAKPSKGGRWGMPTSSDSCCCCELQCCCLSQATAPLERQSILRLGDGGAAGSLPAPQFSRRLGYNCTRSPSPGSVDFKRR